MGQTTQQCAKLIFLVIGRHQNLALAFFVVSAETTAKYMKYSGTVLESQCTYLSRIAVKTVSLPLLFSNTNFRQGASRKGKFQTTFESKRSLSG